MKVADTDRGQQALDNIKAALEKMGPEKVKEFGLIAQGMAIMSNRVTRRRDRLEVLP